MGNGIDFSSGHAKLARAIATLSKGEGEEELVGLLGDIRDLLEDIAESASNFAWEGEEEKLRDLVDNLVRPSILAWD